MKLRIVEDMNNLFRVEELSDNPNSSSPTVHLRVHPTSYKEAKELYEKIIANYEYNQRSRADKRVVEEREV